jgi:hypothetical protein
MTVLDDVRYAFRSLAKSRAFAAIAAGTLALGIGANTALFSVVNAVLLRPLPYGDPERIGVVWRTSPASPEQPHAAGDFLDLLRDTRSFEAAAASRGTSLDLVRGGGEPHRLDAAEVTSRFFEVFGVAALRGRTLRSDTDRPGDPRVVLSHGAWHRVFGGDPSVVGAVVRLASRPTTVVGVMPPDFAWPPEAEAWVLAERAVPSSPVATGGDPEQHRGLSYLGVVARLRPGTSWADAGAELDALAVRLGSSPCTSSSRAGCGLRSSSSSASLASSWRSPAPTSPACCSPAVTTGGGRWRCALRWGPLRRVSCDRRWPSPWCWRCSAAASGCCWRTDARTC